MISRHELYTFEITSSGSFGAWLYYALRFTKEKGQIYKATGAENQLCKLGGSLLLFPSGDPREELQVSLVHLSVTPHFISTFYNTEEGVENLILQEIEELGYL